MSLVNNNPRLAVLIDADNTFNVIPIIDELFEEISKFGDASVRRIYGDWTSENLKSWKPVLPKHAISSNNSSIIGITLNVLSASISTASLGLLLTGHQRT